jgi:hypothetical protein
MWEVMYGIERLYIVVMVYNSYCFTGLNLKFEVNQSLRRSGN